MEHGRFRGTTTKNDSDLIAHKDRVKFAQIIEEMLLNQPDCFQVVDVVNASTPNTVMVTMGNFPNGERFYIGCTREHDSRGASQYGLSSEKEWFADGQNLRYRLDITDYGDGIYAEDNWSECNTTAGISLEVLDLLHEIELPDSMYIEDDKSKGRDMSKKTLFEFT